MNTTLRAYVMSGVAFKDTEEGTLTALFTAIGIHTSELDAKTKMYNRIYTDCGEDWYGINVDVIDVEDNAPLIAHFKNKD